MVLDLQEKEKGITDPRNNELLNCLLKSFVSNANCLSTLPKETLPKEVLSKKFLTRDRSESIAQ